MTFMQLFCGIPFTIVLVLFIISLRRKDIFMELLVGVRFSLTLASLVPIWGVILAIFGIIYLIRDIRNINKQKGLK